MYRFETAPTITNIIGFRTRRFQDFNKAEGMDPFFYVCVQFFFLVRFKLILNTSSFVRWFDIVTKRDGF